MAGDDENFAQEDVVKKKVEELWSKVFESSNKVLRENKVYGFNGMSVPDPNVHERLVALQVFSAVIDVLLNAGKAGLDLEYEQTRQLLNAKSQITTMEQLAAALKANNRTDYDLAVQALDRQLVI